MDIEKLANILGAETIKQIYLDGVQQPVQQVGHIATDIIKMLRLFTYPIQLAASYQDRLFKRLDKVRDAVPENNQIEAPASLAGPILEKFRYLEDENYLTELYMNLLSRAIDKERINEAHPAFPNIIDQLSPDEAMLLFMIGTEPLKIEYNEDIDKEKSILINRKINKDNSDLTKINFPNHFEMYIDHLKSLNLVRWEIIKETAVLDPNLGQTGIYTHSQIHLTSFGKLFFKACVPKDGFIVYANRGRNNL